MNFPHLLTVSVLGCCVHLLMPCPSLAQPIESDEFVRDCADCPELVVLSAGEFERLDDPDPWIRGTRAEKGSVHEVSVSTPFAIGRFEVTMAEFQQCVEAGVCSRQPEQPDGAGPAHPVVNINWHEAQEYVEWLSLETGQTYRLPTEAEWEYAARAGQHEKFFSSNSEEVICRLANVAGQESGLDWANDVCRDEYPGTAPTGSFDANAYGLYDMAGNVWEWVEDCYHDAGWADRDDWSMKHQDRTPRDGSAFIGTAAECHTRLMRGGSWRNGGMHVFSPHYRNFDHAVRRYSNLGFRVVRESPRK